MKNRNIVWLGVSIIMILAILPVLACAPTATPAGTIPMVISTNPANGAQNVVGHTLVTATFNEAMNASTLNTTTFTLVQGSTPVSGKVTYAGTKATFTPDADLNLCTTYTARITTGAQDPAGNALATDYVWNFYTSCASGTGAPVVGGTTTVGTSGYSVGGIFGGGGGTPASGVGTTIPTVTGTNPYSGQTCVGVNSQITATFSGIISSITNITFTLMQGNTRVLGTVTYAGTKATFTPAVALLPNSTFTATVAIRAGSSLPVTHAWTFTTCSGLPMVLSTVPINNDLVCWPPNGSISAIFNHPMNQLTINPATFVVKQGATTVAGTVSYSGLTAIFTPTAPAFAISSTYIATITTGVADLSGNHPAAPYTWIFNTCSSIDTTRPTVISTIPGTGATGVPINTAVAVTFSKAMNPLTLNNLTFTLADITHPAPITATSILTIGAVATFTPNANLTAGDTYTATITTGVTDLAGNHLLASYHWNFTVLASIPPPLGPLLPPLLTAGNYTILTETGISNSGAFPLTTITGDIGTLSAATLITGFGTLPLVPPGEYSTSLEVIGKVYAFDYATPTPANLTAAETQMTNAYTQTANANDVAPVVDTGASGELAGLSLVPGIYKFDSSQPNVTLHGTLHLAAVGANDTWIFQIPGTLTVFPGSNVIVDPPGQAKNVYWQVAGVPQIQSSASTPTTFSGIILSYLGIAVGDHATIHGKALSQAAVTLIADQVLLP